MRAIAACQLGITIASFALGWIGEPALAVVLGPLLAARPRFDTSPTMAHAVAIAIAFTLITVLHIVLGDMAPKGIALQRPESTVLWIARPLHLLLHRPALADCRLSTPSAMPCCA